jgi:predicted MFS family arabinose efflux permease
MVVGALLSALGWLFAPLAMGPLVVVVLLLLIGQFLDGFAYPLYFVNQVSLRQALTPDRWQGRVAATLRVVFWGAMPPGALLGGVLGDTIGLRPTLLLAALGMLVACAWVLVSPLRALREPPAVMPTPEALEPTLLG